MQAQEQGHTQRMRMLSGISALVGIWLIAAPSALGIPSGPCSWNGVIAGALILVFSGIRLLSRHTPVLSWGSAIVGAWVVMSPWVFNYLTAGFRTWNYVIAGALVAVIAVLSLTSSAVQNPWTPKSASTAKSDKILR